MEKTEAEMLIRVLDDAESALEHAQVFAPTMQMGQLTVFEFTRKIDVSLPAFVTLARRFSKTSTRMTSRIGRASEVPLVIQMRSTGSTTQPGRTSTATIPKARTISMCRRF